MIGLLINIIMKYLISRCERIITLKSGKKILPMVKYQLDNIDEIEFFDEDGLYRKIELEDNSNITSVKIFNDIYYFLHLERMNVFATNIKYLNKIININITNSLIITLDGEVLVKTKIWNISYSHFEIWKEYLLIYFNGDRDYVVIIKKDQCIASLYVDEYNEDKSDRYFLTNLFDGLKHGRVVHIGVTDESYVVYLENEVPCTNIEFLSKLFLDCMLAENYSYANKLLVEDIRQTPNNKLKEFFPTFDAFYPLEDNVVILFDTQDVNDKKNTLAGIYKFEIINNQISNIYELEPMS